MQAGLRESTSKTQLHTKKRQRRLANVMAEPFTKIVYIALYEVLFNVTIRFHRSHYNYFSACIISSLFYIFSCRWTRKQGQEFVVASKQSPRSHRYHSIAPMHVTNLHKAYFVGRPLRTIEFIVTKQA
jgi:hypothetical protein